MTAHRPVWAEVDLAAIADNVRALQTIAAPAELLAVVKADAYGHGAIPVSRAAVDAGVSTLGVALVEEGVTLRDAGIDASILVLSEPVPDAAETVVQRGLTPVVYTASGIDALAKAVAATGAATPLDVHLKIDTGMHRVGCRPADALDLARHVVSHRELRLAGTLTHFAVADEPANPYTAEQLARFDDVLDEMRSNGIEPGTVHACNTAGTLAVPAACRDLVRVGIGLYGIAPAAVLEGTVALRPVLSVKARVSYVKDVEPHTSLSYGLRYTTDRATRIATVPVGYADGVPRALGHRGAHALVRGRRCAVAGTITMDQLMLDVGDLPVEVGDEVVLLGRQGDVAVSAAEWADLVDTIPYEIVCGIGPRCTPEVHRVKLQSAGKAALVTVGAAAGLAAAGWTTQRVAAARVRRNDDADARRALDTPIYVDHRLDSHDRGTIYIVESGEGPPIVLSHGVTLSVRTWFHQLEQLPKAGFRAIAYDHRGHGESVLGEAGHSLENLAEDVKTVVTGLDLRDAILVGHSMGGVAVQSFVLRYPEIARERVRGIVLLSTLAHTPFGSRSTQMKNRLEKIFKRVPDSAPLWKSKNLGFVLARLGFGTDPHPSHVELVRQMMLACPAETRRDAPRVLVGLDLLDDLPKIEIPTLVIGGTADALTPPAYAKQIAKAIPGARLELVPDGGHMLMLERTVLLDQLIVDFAREVGVRP